MKKLRKIQALLLSLALLVPIACNGTAVSILNDTQAVSAPLNFDEAVVESVKKESDNPTGLVISLTILTTQPHMRKL